MSNLSRVFVFKIAATVLFWCIPLILFPAALLGSAGFPEQDTYMFVRMLGWAYLALCVGYWFGLQASLQGKRAMGPIRVGIVSNGGAFLYLSYYGLTGTWEPWGGFVQFVGWSSVVATFFIAAGLLHFGIGGEGEQV